MWAYVWVLIPLAGIMAGMWSEWLKFKEKQARLGNTAESLESSFAELSSRLEAQNRVLVERIQNLETIVTSADWDQISPVSTLPEPEPQVLLPEPGEEEREEAARLAQRLRS